MEKCFNPFDICVCSSKKQYGKLNEQRFYKTVGPVGADKSRQLREGMGACVSLCLSVLTE